MNLAQPTTIYRTLPVAAAAAYLPLQKALVRICMLNFLLLSLAGLLLRAFPAIQLSFLPYKNLLHAHSHFAFGGWVMPALLALVLKFFPETCTTGNFRHWRNCIVLMLVAAYGMLLSFPFQGYGVVSIVFSTLSIVAGCYAGLVTRTAVKAAGNTTSKSFLLAGFFFFFLAAIGPFATGPLIAMGKAGTPLYFNAIYFYLHFEYNGFFTFMILAVLYRMLERHGAAHRGKLVFRLLLIGCMPAYFLSVLWTKPHALFYIAGGAAALLQLIAVAFLVRDIKKLKLKEKPGGWIFRIAILAFVAKSLLQFLSAFPVVAELAFRNRDFIIAYLHLVLLGFISLFILAVFSKNIAPQKKGMFNTGMACFLFAFISTELLLVLQAGGLLQALQPLHYYQLLFVLSTCFPAGLILISAALRSQKMRVASKVLSFERP